MFLSKLFILNFKNHQENYLDLSSNINCFVGDNGSGKTNFLDAIHYLSFTKSYFNNQDSLNIKHDQHFFSIEGFFNKNGVQDSIHCGVKRGAKKIIRCNKKKYNRFADHIGLFPVVMISPTDNSLLLGGSELRRKYMDSVISQFDRSYLESLIQYNKLILHRNAILKNMTKNDKIDHSALDLYDDQLVPLSIKIFERRKSFLEDLLPIFNTYYSSISSSNEQVNILYKSQLLAGDLGDILKENRRQDCFLQFTSAGIHKDDLSFQLNDFLIKKTGSQGQQKTFLLALKLAQFDFMKNSLGYKPILLLDDIFDKLDDKRVEQLITLVDQHNFGQIFITDSHPDRIVYIFNKIKAEFKVFYVKNGSIEKKK